MRAIERFVRRTAGPRGVTTQLLRYWVAGWNGTTADAYLDVWAVEQIRAEPMFVLSPVLMTRTLAKGTGAPPTEKRTSSSRHGNADYVGRTMGFLPRPPK
jgi:steroid 5-alpha reductase family enzyme